MARTFNEFSYSYVDDELINKFFIQHKNEKVQYVLSHAKFYKDFLNDTEQNEVSMYFLIALVKHIGKYKQNIPIKKYFENFSTTQFEYKKVQFDYRQLYNYSADSSSLQYIKLVSKIQKYINLMSAVGIKEITTSLGEKQDDISNIMFKNLDFNKISLESIKKYNISEKSSYSDISDVSSKIIDVVNKFTKQSMDTPEIKKLDNDIPELFRKFVGGSEIVKPKLYVEGVYNENKFVSMIVNCILDNNPSQFKQCAHSLANTQMRPKYYTKFVKLPLETRLAMLRALDVKLTEKYENGKKKYIVETFEEWEKRNKDKLKDINFDTIQFEPTATVPATPIVSTTPAVPVVGGMHKLRRGGNPEATYALIAFIVHTLIDSVMHEQDKIGSLIQQDKSEMPTNSMGLKYVTQKQLQSQGEQYQKLGAFGYPPCDMAGRNQLDQMSKLNKSMSGGGMQMGGASIFDRNFDILVKELKSKGHDLNSADVDKMKELIKKLEQLEEDMVEIISNIAKYNKAAKIQDTTSVSYDGMVDTLEKLKKNGQAQNEKQNEIIGLFKEFYEVLNKFSSKTNQFTKNF